MPALNVPQGTINRLRASVIIPLFPQLNVTASFLGKEGIRLAFDGASVTYIDTMTGAVPSPEPYVKTTVTMHLLKSQSLADLYKRQWEILSTLGNANVRPDANTLSPFLLVNSSIMGVRELDFSGADAGYAVSLGAYYNLNSALYAT